MKNKIIAGVLGSLAILGFLSHLGSQTSVADIQTVVSTPTPTISPTPTFTPTDTPTPTIYVVPTSTQTQTSTYTTSSLSNDNYYTTVDGNQVHAPAYSTNGNTPAGATAQCSDGTYSFSQHISGTCSYHGDVATWY